MSCSKSSDDAPECDFDAADVEFATYCSFNPKLHPSVAFPCGLKYKGERIDNQKYSFSWGDSFDGSSKSLVYNDLPEEVTVVEKESNCSVTVSIDKSFFD